MAKDVTGVSHTCPKIDAVIAYINSAMKNMGEEWNDEGHRMIDLLESVRLANSELRMKVITYDMELKLSKDEIMEYERKMGLVSTALNEYDAISTSSLIRKKENAELKRLGLYGV